MYSPSYLKLPQKPSSLQPIPPGMLPSQHGTGKCLRASVSIWLAFQRFNLNRVAKEYIRVMCIYIYIHAANTELKIATRPL